MKGNQCNLEVTRNGMRECWSLCSKYHNGYACCRFCKEKDKCKKVCGWMRDKK